MSIKYILTIKILTFFNATVRSMMMGHSSPQHVRFDVLKRYCGSAELCAFVCLHFSNRFIMRVMKNVKYRLDRNKIKRKNISSETTLIQMVIC